MPVVWTHYYDPDRTDTMVTSNRDIQYLFGHVARCSCFVRGPAPVFLFHKVEGLSYWFVSVPRYYGVVQGRVGFIDSRCLVTGSAAGKYRRIALLHRIPPGSKVDAACAGTRFGLGAFPGLSGTTPYSATIAA